jgi:nucleoside-diphosphate-sugar epimerase
MKIAITGASGYLGSKILESLIKNKTINEIAVINHVNPIKVNSSKIKIYNSSDELAQAVRGAKFIIHFAAFYTSKSDNVSIDKLINANVLFTSHLFKLAQSEENCRIIMPTTFSMFSNSKNPDLPNYNNYYPKTVYDVTKSFAELLAISLNLNVVFLRLSDTFGEDDKRSKIINLIRNSVKNHEELTLKKSSNFMLNVISVKDLINIINLMMTKQYTGIKKYDLFYPENIITLGQIVKIFDKSGIYIHCSKEQYPQEIIYQKYIIPEYKIKFPIYEELKKVR